MRKITLSLFMMFSLIAFAQPGSIDPTFNPTDIGFGNGDGPNQQVLCMVTQPDGKILLGGLFTTFNGISRARITRINPDGTLDATFNPGTGANNFVQCITLQSDGKILIGGAFTSYNGSSRSRLARLNADGSLDTGFTIGSGADSTIYTIAVQSNGKILIGGDFGGFNGTSIASYLLRLQANGSADNSFVSFASGPVRTMLVRPDGKILIGGNFGGYGVSNSARMALLNNDGTVDATFNSGGTGANNFIHSMVLRGDGKIIVAGNFTTFNGTTRNRLALLNANGTLDTAFNPSAGPNNAVLSVALQSNGQLLLAGQFSTYNGTARRSLARVNTDGTNDATFDPGAGALNELSVIAAQPDGSALIGGNFIIYKGTNRRYLARVTNTGTLDNSFNAGSGADGFVNDLTVQPDGKILVAGRFERFNGLPINRLVRLNADGTTDPSFNVGTGTNNSINKILLQPDGKVIIGGTFNTYNDQPRVGLARLNADGSLDHSFLPPSGVVNYPYALFLMSDGKLLVGGSFSGGIMRLNADGSTDTSFSVGAGFNGLVQAIILQPDGKIWAGGSFTAYDGVPAQRLARLNPDGTRDDSFSQPNISGTVWSLAIQHDGKILVGGNISYNSFNTRYGIIRLNADVSPDFNFNIGLGAPDVNSIVLQPDGKILIGGAFTYYNNTNGINRLARLNVDGSLDTTFNQGTGANDTVLTMAIQPDDKILIGGVFTVYNATGRNRIARINNDPKFNLQLSLKLFIQGYFLGASAMTPVSYNQGVAGSTLQDVEAITVELRYAVTHGLAATAQATLHTDGMAECVFSPTAAGPYYLVIKSGNAIQTWSSNPVLLSGGTPTTYDFTTAAHQAYGDNMIELEPGVFGFYSGDINQDEAIDASDIVDITNDADASAYGELMTDLNGDGSVDNSDLPVVVNNAEFSIFCNKP